MAKKKNYLSIRVLDPQMREDLQRLAQMRSNDTYTVTPSGLVRGWMSKELAEAPELQKRAAAAR